MESQRRVYRGYVRGVFQYSPLECYLDSCITNALRAGVFQLLSEFLFGKYIQQGEETRRELQRKRFSDQDTQLAAHLTIGGNTYNNSVKKGGAPHEVLKDTFTTGEALVVGCAFALWNAAV